MAEHSLGQIVAYFTVCEILADASTGTDGVLWCERSGFCRCGFATLGYSSGVAAFYEIAPGEIIPYFCNNDGVLLAEGYTGYTSQTVLRSCRVCLV